MRPLVFLTCFAAVLLHGASGSDPPRGTAHKLLQHIVGKRQVNIGCLNEKLQDLYSDNDFLAQCQTAAYDGADLDLSSLVYQSTINTIFQQFCEPECGNPILEALADCGAEDYIIDFYVGLCGTNADGDSCYEGFVTATSFVQRETVCVANYDQYGSCSCSSDLSSVVEQLGCCVNVYNDYYMNFVEFDVDELYDGCGVETPRDCNNSPISGSNVVVFNLAALLTALGLNIFLG